MCFGFFARLVVFFLRLISDFFARVFDMTKCASGKLLPEFVTKQALSISTKVVARQLVTEQYGQHSASLLGLYCAKDQDMSPQVSKLISIMVKCC